MDADIHSLLQNDIPSPTRTEAEKLVAELCAQIDAIAERIPTRNAGPFMEGRMRASRTVSREFIASMAFVVEHTASLAALGTFDSQNARAMLQFTSAFRVFTDRVAVLLTSVNHTLESWRTEVAEEAIQTYAIAKGMARDPGSAELAGHVANLRRDLGRRNGSHTSHKSDPV